MKFTLVECQNWSFNSSKRRSIGIELKKLKSLKEKLFEIQIDRSALGSSASSSSRGKMTLKTTDMETVYDLGQKMIEALSKERVQSRGKLEYCSVFY